MFCGVGVLCYSTVVNYMYLNVSFIGLIITIAEEKAAVSAIDLSSLRKHSHAIYSLISRL